jgi:Helicase associated domain
MNSSNLFSPLEININPRAGKGFVMSLKRKGIAKYPPTEGKTEDTDVIDEPTTAKRARTGKRGKNKISEVAGKEEMTTPDFRRFVEGISIATDVEVAALPVEFEETTDDSAAYTEAVTPETAIATAAAPIVKPTWVKRAPNPNFPSHLNPTDPTHFDQFLFQLLAFRAETNSGGFNVFKDEYPALYAWLQQIKKEYKQFANGAPNCQLTAQQVLVLESLHIPITSRGDDHWNRYYDLLVQYKARHGHVLVPRVCEVPGLGDWVTDQRRQHKAKQQGQATQMTTTRQEKLDELEFVWHVRNRPEWVRSCGLPVARVSRVRLYFLFILL